MSDDAPRRVGDCQTALSRRRGADIDRRRQPAPVLLTVWPSSGHTMAMKRVGVADLKNNLSRHLRAVQDGEEIEITDHERPVARLIPVRTKSRLEIRPPERSFSEIRDRVYEPANWPVSSLDLLLEDRAKR